MEWDRIFMHKTSDKWLIFKIINTHKMQQQKYSMTAIHIWQKEMTTGDTWMSRRYRKKFSLLLMTQEMQIKQCWYIISSLAKRIEQIKKYGKSHHWQHYGENVVWFSLIEGSWWHGAPMPVSKESPWSRQRIRPWTEPYKWPGEAPPTSWNSDCSMTLHWPLSGNLKLKLSQWGHWWWAICSSGGIGIAKLWEWKICDGQLYN